MPTPTWSAPVRYAEVDGQEVVFNAHYLTWCDEAMSAFLTQRSTPTLDLVPYSVGVRLVTTTLTWQQPAAWGDVVAVDAVCAAVGRTSMTMGFEISTGRGPVCSVTTVYVNVGPDDVPAPFPDDVRAALTA